jgi:hypothetical protein
MECLYWLAMPIIALGIIFVGVGVNEWWKWRKEVGEDFINGGGQQT